MDLIVFLLPLLLLVFLFTSQRKRQRSAQQLQSELQPGLQVVTTSGLFARVVELDDVVVVLETAPGQRVRWDRRAIGGVVPEGGRGYLPHNGALEGPVVVPGAEPRPVAGSDAGTNPGASSLTPATDPVDPTQTAPGEPGHPARPGDQNPRS